MKELDINRYMFERNVFSDFIYMSKGSWDGKQLIIEFKTWFVDKEM